MESRNLERMHFIEKGRLSSHNAAQRSKKKGGRRQVSSTILLKTNVERMSVCGLSTMLLKMHELQFPLHDFGENTGS